MTLLPPPFSRINRVVLVIGIVCLVTTFAGVIFVAARNDDNPGKAKAGLSTKPGVADRFGRLPLSFEINKGQVEQPVKFLSARRAQDFSRTRGTSSCSQSFQPHSCGRANADGAATQVKRKPAGVSRLFRPRQVRRQIFRKLDEPGPDELLDDWMVSGPAAEPTSSG